MALTRRVRRSGKGLAVQVPGDVAKLLELSAGDLLAWDVHAAGVFRVRRVDGHQREPAGR